MSVLAPSEEILAEYKKKKGDWHTYEKTFLALMEERQIENVVSPDELDRTCLLCSEHLPKHCHRRLVAEYLKNKWGNVENEHLVEKWAGMDLIVTDLTRFAKDDIVCIAGIDLNQNNVSGRCHIFRRRNVSDLNSSGSNIRGEIHKTQTS